jgi:hypothetical protein
MERKTFEKKQIVSSTLKHQSIETAVFQASGFADWMGNHGSPNPSSRGNSPQSGSKSTTSLAKMNQIH